MKRLLLVGLIPMMACLFAFYPSAKAPKITNMAPQFDGVTTKGKAISLKDLKGEVVVMHIWAAWSEPSLKEFPKMNEFKSKYDDRVKFISVTDDDTVKINKIFKAKNLQLDYDLIANRADIMKMYSRAELKDFNQGITKKLEAKPMHVVIDQRGMIMYYQKGVSETYIQDIKIVVDRALANKPKKLD